MIETVKILTVLLPVLYAMATANSIFLFVSDSDTGRKIDKPLLGITVGVHLVTFVLHSIALRRCPLGTVFEAMGLMAFSLVAVYYVLVVRRGVRPTGVLILPLAFLLMVLSVFFGDVSAPANPALTSVWFNIHVLAAVLGIAALAVSFVHGIFFLLMYRQFKHHRFGLFFRRLPPLADLNRMTQLAALVGWAFLTVTIGAGYIWAARDGSLARLHSDGMFLVTFGTWVLYTVGLTARYLAGWRGQSTVYLSVCGFALLLVSMVLLSFLFPAAMHGASR